MSIPYKRSVFTGAPTVDIGSDNHLKSSATNIHPHVFRNRHSLVRCSGAIGQPAAGQDEIVSRRICNHHCRRCGSRRIRIKIFGIGLPGKAERSRQRFRHSISGRILASPALIIPGYGLIAVRFERCRIQRNLNRIIVQSEGCIGIGRHALSIIQQSQRSSVLVKIGCCQPAAENIIPGFQSISHSQFD